MKKYIVLMLLIFWGCQGNTSADDDLAKNNPMAFSVLLAAFEKESAPDFDSHVLAYAKLAPVDDDFLGWNPLAFNDIVTYFPKTASLLLKYKKCAFFLIRQKKENAKSFGVLHSIDAKGALIYHIIPTDAKGEACQVTYSVDYWGFLVEDCSRTWGEIIPVSYETYESPSWKCDDVVPFTTQNEWISPSLL